MIKTTLVTGIALIAIGAAVLGFDHYNYTTTDEVLKIGPITATAEQTHTVWLPAALGWGLMAAGVAVFAFAALSKNK